MEFNYLGTSAYGIKCPIIRNGDDIKQVVFESVMSATNGQLDELDIIGITESVIARSLGLYVTINDIVESIDKVIGNKNIALWCPIMSRNRFSLILRAFARYCDKLVILIDKCADEQGNPTCGVNPFTGVDVVSYYTDICKEENCEVLFKSTDIYGNGYSPEEYGYVVVDARCHPCHEFAYDLSMICGNISSFGLLGSNKADEETLKLFPDKEHSQNIVNELQRMFVEKTGKRVEVMIYGDGCFKSPYSEGVSIWEFADPVTSPAYTEGLRGTPNEIKLKNLVDGKFSQLTGDELDNAIKEEIERQASENTIGAMGTTPRQYVDLLASLMDLVSGSGGKGTPVVLVKNYFNNFAS